MRKLSFLELEREMDLLSEEEASRTKGGGREPGPNGYCTFNVMSYIDSHLSSSTGGGHGYSYLDYFSAYVNQEGMSGVNYGSQGNISSIDVGRGSDYFEFMKNNFDLTRLDSAPTIANKIVNGDGIVTAQINNHNVVLTGYNGSTGKITYYDPTTQSFNSRMALEHNSDGSLKLNEKGNPIFSFGNCLYVTGQKGFYPQSTNVPTTTVPTTTMPSTTYPTTTVM